MFNNTRKKAQKETRPIQEEIASNQEILTDEKLSEVSGGKPSPGNGPTYPKPPRFPVNA
jgi:hypothetical protein